MAEAKRRTIGEMSTDARILYNLIVAKLVKENLDFIAYADLNAAIGGRDVQGDARGLLTTARRNVERDHNLLIETVPKEGIKKSVAVAGVLDRTVAHIGRVSRRASSRIVNACVNRELSSEERTSVGVQLSLLGAIQQFAKPKAARQLEAKVRENEMKELPSAETIRLFSTNGEK